MNRFKPFLRWAPSALAALMLIAIMLPWARTGVGFDASEVLGSEIPVLNWSALTAISAVLLCSTLATWRGGRWLWLLANGFAALVVTSAAVVLGTLDVIDGSVARWVVRALPQDLEDVTPRLSPAWGLTLVFVLSVAVFGLTFCSTVRACGSTRDDPAIESSAAPGLPAAVGSIVEDLEWK